MSDLSPTDVLREAPEATVFTIVNAVTSRWVEVPHTRGHLVDREGMVAEIRSAIAALAVRPVVPVDGKETGDMLGQVRQAHPDMVEQTVSLPEGFADHDEWMSQYRKHTRDVAARARACPKCGNELHGYQGPLCRYCDPEAYSE